MAILNTLKQINRELSLLDKSEDRLDAVVHASIVHVMKPEHTFSPDALNSVNAWFLSHLRTGQAARYREFVEATTPMKWIDKESTFKLDKRKRDKSEEFEEQWAANLLLNWRVKLDKQGDDAEKPTVRTLAQRVESAKKRAEKDHTPTTQERIEAAKILLADMTAAEIVTALGNKAEFVLDALVVDKAA